MARIVPLQRWLNKTISVPFVGRVARNGTNPMDVEDRVASWLVMNNFARYATEEDQTQPVKHIDDGLRMEDPESQMLQDVLPQQEIRELALEHLGAPMGQAATGHLSSAGTFATENPAGVPEDKPPSTQVSEANLAGMAVPIQPTLRNSGTFATINPSGIEIPPLGDNLDDQIATGTENPTSLKVSAAHRESEGSVEVLPTPSQVAQDLMLESETDTNKSTILEFLNTAPSKDEIASTIKGIGPSTGEKLVEARPLTWEALEELLSDRQMDALRAWVKTKVVS